MDSIKRTQEVSRFDVWEPKKPTLLGKICLEAFMLLAEKPKTFLGGIFLLSFLLGTLCGVWLWG